MTEIEAVARALAKVEHAKDWQRFIPQVRVAVHTIFGYVRSAMIEAETDDGLGDHEFTKDTLSDLASLIRLTNRLS